MSEISDQSLRDLDFRRERVRLLALDLVEWQARHRDSSRRLQSANAAWEQAERPSVEQPDVSTATANADQAEARRAEAERGLNRVRGAVRLLDLRVRVRRLGDPLGLPWWTLALSGAAIGFALFTFFALPFARGMAGVLWFAILGFLTGLVGSAYVLLFPTDEDLDGSRATLEKDREVRECQLAELRQEAETAREFARAIEELFQIVSERRDAHAAFLEAQEQANKLATFHRDESASLETLERQCSQQNRLYQSNWRDLTGVAFEEFLRDIFVLLGYQVDLTKTTGDQGVDLVLTKGNQKIAIQAKGYPNTTVGNKAIQEAFTGMAIYRCSKSAVVTNSTFTSSAREAARSVGCELIDGGQIEALIFGRLVL